MPDVPDVPALTATALDALRSYDLVDPRLTLLNVSENATFRVDDPRVGTTALRVHRPDYHDAGAIASELSWVAALRADGIVRTPDVVPTLDGGPIAGATYPDGTSRHAVMFTWMPGTEPPEEHLVADFEELGALSAELHLHAKQWTPPDGFVRMRWDWSTSIGDQGHWGRWQDGVDVGAAELDILGRACDAVGQRLTAYGDSPDRFGLIHADMRLANLLVDGDGPQRQVAVIDFDDCGFGWYHYDLGSSLSFIEHDPRVPELIDSWVTGYRSVTSLSVEEEAELPTFVMLRRLLLVAWIGSHRGTELAETMGAEYTSVSCDLADRYLTTVA